MRNYFEHKMRKKNPAVIAGMVVLGILAIGGLITLFGFTVMWLWNWLMPELFGLPTLTFWKAVGVIILSKLLFGGFGGGGKSGKSGKKRKKSCESDTSKKKDFSKWKHYDSFWKEEGDKAYEAYCQRLENPESSQSELDEDSSETNKTVE
ncbi:MAG: hypothetical protein HWE22_04825 [Flavobacteriales bacterium]|nr:hypothetical protein [Flavobacteriales bacterium]